MFQTSIFPFPLIEILINFVEAFILHYCDMLNKLAVIACSLCFKKQTLEFLLYLSSEAELPSNGLQDISFYVLKSIQM